MKSEVSFIITLLICFLAGINQKMKGSLFSINVLRVYKQKKYYKLRNYY